MTSANSEFTKRFLLLSYTPFSFCYWREKMTGLASWEVPSAVHQRVTEHRSGQTLFRGRETAGHDPWRLSQSSPPSVQTSCPASELSPRERARSQSSPSF